MVSSETIDNRIEFIEQINSKKSTRDLSLRDKIKSQEWFFSFSNKLPPDWIEVNFMDITWSITCGVAKRPTYVNDGVPFLSAQNARPFKTNLDKIRFISEKEFKQLTVGGKPEKNDILYTRVGNCGEAAKIKYDFDFGIYVSLTLIKPIHELIDSDYLVAFLNGYYGRQQANVGAIGIGLKNLNVDNVRKFRVPLPPLKTQQQIVSKIEELFSELDKGIEELKTAQRQLNVYRQAVLKWAFERPEKSTNYTLAEVCDFITKGTTPAKSDLFSNQGEVPFLKVYNLTFDGSLDFTKEPTYVTKETADGFLRRSQVFPGDILMNIVGPPLGKVSIVPSTYPEWNINQAIVRFRCKEVLLNKYLLHFLLSEHTIRSYSMKAKATAGQFNLTLEICRDIEIPIPSIEEQIQIVQEIESRISVCDKIEETINDSLKQAAALRQSILKKAFEGRLI